MIKKILFYCTFSLFLTSTIFAQSAGNSGLAFLKMGFGARNIAMGNTGAEVSNGVTSLFYNPANLTLSSGSETILMHNQWIQGIKSELLGVSSKLFGISFALGFNVTTVNDIEVRTKPGLPISTFNANYFFGSFSSGFNLTRNISTGFSIKYLYEGMLSNDATGWGFDFGLNYITPIKGLRADVVIKNLGYMNKLKNESTKLPSEIRIGPAYSFKLLNPKIKITTAAEIQKYTGANNVHINTGVEILYDNLLALRGGYQSGYKSKSFTAGFGLNWGNLSFDYAFQPFSFGLGNANMFSLRFKF